uniref:U18-hexatoxin-Hi1b_3 n=2 Tax=Hadronyche infensa TaxID=153481 RepID=A0A1D0BZG7_HADIN
MRIHYLLILSFLLLASGVLINSEEMPRSEMSPSRSFLQGRGNPPEGICLGHMVECNKFNDNCCAGWLKCKCDLGFFLNCKCYQRSKKRLKGNPRRT